MSRVTGGADVAHRRRPMRPVVLAYLALSTLAAGLQGSVGAVHPVGYAMLTLVTVLALRGDPHRWTLALVVAHLVIHLVRGAPVGFAAWAAAAALATVLGSLHLCAPWLPWRHRRLHPSPATVSTWMTQAGTVLAVASATAVSAALVAAPPGAGPALAVLALTGIVGVTVAEARRRFTTPSET
ncbi:MAG: hypothetical protein ACRCY8_08595 [Dermatophilaceae bacterium]